MYFEATAKLAGDILVKVDRMSMANSLEVRCPLLDHELAEMANRIPNRWKTRDGRGKLILLKALGDRLPAALLSRPKRGFGVPLAKWFRGPLRNHALGPSDLEDIPGARLHYPAEDRRDAAGARQRTPEQLRFSVAVVDPGAVVHRSDRSARRSSQGAAPAYIHHPVTQPTTAGAADAVPRTRRYLTNVLWTWGGVAVGMVSGFLVSPYTIRKLGDVNFSLWSLALSLVEYYWLIDFGLRSATVKMSAEYRALGDNEGLNELVSTGVLYSSIMGALLAVATLLGAPHVGRIFHIDQPAFRQLVLIAGLSWSLGMVFNIYSACLDGFQRFDIFGRIWIVTSILRSAAVVLVLYFGQGLLQMGFVLLGDPVTVLWTHLYQFPAGDSVCAGVLRARHVFDVQKDGELRDPYVHEHRRDPTAASERTRF